ncbi:MAG: sodium:solute symporter family protein [Acidobacteria bacterium]|nr:sodium:solute symporter family protein [Acidobacteriota bacterium]
MIQNDPVLTAVVLYLSLLVLIGVWRSRRIRTGDDFLVAGRRRPARLQVLTLRATRVGKGSQVGGARQGYRSGFSALWQSAGAWVGIALVYFIAPRVRRIAQYTVPDILELRYGWAARVLGTITTVFAYGTIAAYQFRGGGRLLELVAGIDPGTGALATAIFCIVFTSLAGMLSIAYIDVGNGLVMTIAVTLGVAFLVNDAGGLGASIARLEPHQVSLFGDIGPQAAFALFLPTMFLLLGEANMYQKFFSARDERAARLAVVGWIAGTIVVETLIDSTGIFGSLRIAGLDTAASEAIVIQVATDVLPPALGVLLVCGAAAIVVSTANSFLLTPSTNLIRDVYQRFINPAVTDRQVVVYTRLIVVAVGALGYYVGNFFPSILAMALWAYTMYGAGITPALLGALLWKRATRAGGVASILAGMSTTLVWEIIGLVRAVDGEPAYLFGWQTAYPALALSIATLIVVSLLTPPPTRAEVELSAAPVSS